MRRGRGREGIGEGRRESCEAPGAQAGGEEPRPRQGERRGREPRGLRLSPL